MNGSIPVTTHVPPSIRFLLHYVGRLLERLFLRMERPRGVHRTGISHEQAFSTNKFARNSEGFKGSSVLREKDTIQSWLSALPGECVAY